MSENEKPRIPNHVVQLEVNGAAVEIREFLGGPDTINDIIARRIRQDADPHLSPSGDNVQ